MRLIGILIGLVILLVGPGARAQTLNLPGGETHFTLSYLTPIGGQRFVALNKQAAFTVFMEGSQSEVMASIHEWSSGAPGPSLWVGPPFSVGYQNDNYEPVTITPEVKLEPGKTYALLFNLVDVENGFVAVLGSDAIYPDGGVLFYEVPAGPAWVTMSYSFAMDAAFSSGAEPIPTLSEWAMILLGGALAGGAALTLHRRRAQS
ncbi:IPTL-CTERM sorting domain-containing protein [Brevundimonas guildfordensis]|uniref:IPTL-CTERM sorting domain-containing protein n=1 Tax=Brevundimonas guildfordensis TaxID=2762241 RepID=A0ABR8R190_9CAUL|nr:IPTL-CTERM sorting domain-containing protein [Brevundimonas guildfordensis]MBD7941576.1 IPTL-CTERM sorting domain-containing protein [Brevundimonas guildfordensis]